MRDEELSNRAGLFGLSQVRKISDRFPEIVQQIRLQAESVFCACDERRQSDRAHAAADYYT
jgi:hypothetical protein